MTATLQRSFDTTLADAKHRPTVGMDGARHILDLTSEELWIAIEESHISWAWDIAVGSDRREIRFLRHSLDHYKKLSGLKPLQVISAAPKWDTVLTWLLPPGHTKPFLTTPELQRVLNCDPDHVLHLVEAKLLKLLPGTEYRRGPSGAALVTVESLASFLQKRRLPYA